MSGGGGGQTVVQPSTTTTVQDIPAWEQGYVTNLLGQAQSIAAQPYQQFPGQQVAGFTPDQTQAFSNIEGAGGFNAANQNAALGSAAQGAGTANNIYGAGAPLVNASTVAASPLGIQQYMSPYTNDVVQGIQNEANLNWNQNIMPGINNEFVGSGQFGSGRNAQVLGQTAGNFQTGLSSNIANALQSGYTTAGNQAATEAGLLGSAGSTLGNLAATQAGTQIGAGTALGNIGAQAANTNLTQNTALQAAGQEQQQLNQTNLNTAQQNWQNQVNWPASQTEYLNQIIRGLPAPVANTSAMQSPAYSVSPLAGVGGGVAGLAGLLGGNNSTGAKAGGLVKGYAAGGEVEDDEYGDGTPLDYATRDEAPAMSQENAAAILDLYGPDAGNAPLPAPLQQVAKAEPEQMDDSGASSDSVPLSALDTADSKHDNVNPNAPPASRALTDSQMQNMQLLAMARGLLTPQINGSGMAALGAGFGNVADVGMKALEFNAQQNALNYERQIQQQRLGIEQQNADTMKSYRNWRMQNTGVGAYDTMARGLMHDDPNLTYQDALAKVMKKNVEPNAQTPLATAPTPAKVTLSTDENTEEGGDNDGQQAAPPKAPLTGEDFLKTLPPDRAAMAKAIAMGDQQYPTAFALAKSPALVQALADARQYDPTTNGRRYQNLQKFDTGPLGNQTRYLDVSVAHLDTLGKLTDALGNGDTQAINKLSNTFQSQFGGTAPTNFNAAKNVVAQEVVKAVVGAGGALADREKAQQDIMDSKSPEQLKGVIDTYKTLLSGQLGGLEQQYTATTGRKDFQDKYLTPQARSALSPAKGQSSGAAGLPEGAKLLGTSGGKKVYKLPDGSAVMEQ